VIVGGTDSETLELLNSLPNRISHFRESDEGIYSAMNKSLDKARGKFIWFLNARDKNLLSSEAVLRSIHEQPSVDIIKFYARVKERNYIKEKEILSLIYLVRHTFNHQSYFINIRKLKRYPFNESLKLVGDYFQLLEIWCDRPNVTYIHKDIVDYDLSGATVGSKTNNIIRMERLRSSLIIFVKTKNLKALLISLFQFFIYGPFLFKFLFSRLAYILKK
jgi:glycosyltransferase involved in cell wall biosynthesis